MKSKTKIKFELPYLYIITVFFLTFYAVNYWPIPGTISIASVIGIALPFVICKPFFATKQFIFFFLYAIVVLLNFLLGDIYFGKLNTLFRGFVGFFVSISLSYYIFTKKDFNLVRVIFYIVAIILLWTTIATAIFDMTTPGLVRQANTTFIEGGDTSMYNPMYAMGLSSYAFPHATPFIIPPLMMGVLNSSLEKKQRLLSGVLVLCCLLLAYFSGATGSLIVSIMALFMSLVIHKGTVTDNLVRLGLVAVIMSPFLLDDSFLLAALDWIDGLLGGEGYFHSKVMDFQATIMFNEASGDVDKRRILYNNTLDMIVGNPILGVQEGYGGHSAILDRLASLGLVGFIPFISLLIVQFRFVIKHLKFEYRPYYYVGVFSAFVMLATKNFTGWYVWFFLFSVLPFCVFVNSDADGSFSIKK